MIKPIPLTFEKFQEVSKENKYWLWYLKGERRNESHEIFALDELPTLIDYHPFKIIIDKVKIPVYQTPVYDVLDFILYLDNALLHALKVKKYNEIGPVVLAFNYSRLVDHTINQCFCSKGIVTMIANLNPELLSNFDSD